MKMSTMFWLIEADMVAMIFFSHCALGKIIKRARFDFRKRKGKKIFSGIFSLNVWRRMRKVKR